MSNRVYVGNLSWSTSWQDLKDHMRDVGDVQYAKVLQDRDGRPYSYHAHDGGSIDATGASNGGPK